MLRFLAAVSLCLLCNPAFSTTKKLSCHVDVTRTFPSGNMEKSSGNLILQIETTKDITFITGTGATLDIAVATKNIGPVVDVENVSDEGKWDVTNKVARKDGPPATNQIVIDRNTGDLNFSRMTEGGIDTEAVGTCKKINTAVRKF